MPQNAPVFTVSQITQAVKGLIEGSLTPCWVEGEISNWLAHSSGHCYFSLKDEKSQIRAVVWRSYRPGLKFSPENGTKVLAYGAIKVYERGGSYQINVFSMQPSGVGALQLAFEQLKKKLEKEGLFDEERKRPLPDDVETVGVVTSSTGAAVRDIVNVLRRRSPATRIVLRPALVQGKGAAQDIAEGIRELNEFGKVDLLIVGRGGGSTEDLWAFNEEAVARAIAESGIPVISAVGHEIDFTIADFAADVRAPTPSAAAELAVADATSQRQSLRMLVERFQYAAKSYLGDLHDRLERMQTTLAHHSPEDVVHQYMQRVDELERRMALLLQHTIDRHRSAFAQVLGKLEGLSPLLAFQRGYSIAQHADSKTIVRSVRDVEAGQSLETRVRDGRIRSKIERISGDPRLLG